MLMKENVIGKSHHLVNKAAIIVFRGWYSSQCMVLVLGSRPAASVGLLVALVGLLVVVVGHLVAPLVCQVVAICVHAYMTVNRDAFQMQCAMCPPGNHLS